jgi:RNA polymerase sigma factor (sigma-70 family)
VSPRVSTRLLARQSDHRLLELARRGHERAFEAVVHRYRRPLLRYCARMGISDARAEDVLQQALLAAWLALERGVEVRELRPWLYRIVHNSAVNTLRRAKDDHGPLLDWESGASAAAAEADLEHRLAVQDTLADVADLPRMQREAILLSAVAGRSHDEVADMLGVTDGAVRGLLYRARATLRSAAAALTPPPLIGWACGVGGAGAGSTGERLAELSVPAGAAGMVGVLAKSAAVALTAAVVVAGAAVAPIHRHRGHAARSVSTSHAASASMSPGAGATGEGPLPAARVAGPMLSASTVDVATRGTGGGRTGASPERRLAAAAPGVRSEAVVLLPTTTGLRRSKDRAESSWPGDVRSSEQGRTRAGADTHAPSSHSHDGTSDAAPQQPHDGTHTEAQPSLQAPGGGSGSQASGTPDGSHGQAQPVADELVPASSHDGGSASGTAPATGVESGD